MIIKNFKQLAISRQRETALQIIEAGLEAIQTKNVMKNSVKVKNNILAVKNKKFDLKKYNNIYIIGGGKASHLMAQHLEKLLGNKIKDGIVNSNVNFRLKRIHVIKAGHPIPNEDGSIGVQKMVNLASEAKQDDLVICLISGGGSSLMTSGYGIPLEDKIKLNQLLLKSGANINEMNIVRKHIDDVKGGVLAQYCYPATVISLIFSDVIGDDLSIIASGPTVLDKSTVKDALKIIRKYRLPRIKLKETPKNKKIIKKVHNFCILNNMVALKAMQEKASMLRLKPEIISNKIAGEASLIGKVLVKTAKKGYAILVAGETTVTVHGKGIGGRNQELCLSALRYLRDELIVSIGSDGKDNSNYAGAIVDNKTKEKIKKLKLNINKYLYNNDSYNFFKKTKDFIYTGDTGTNVADLMLVLKN